MFDLGSNTKEIGVYMLTLSWYFDSRETNAILVCISPKRIHVKLSNSGFRMGASPVAIMHHLFKIESEVKTHINSLKTFSLK
jgi:hypothetical protein